MHDGVVSTALLEAESRHQLLVLGGSILNDATLAEIIIVTEPAGGPVEASDVCSAATPLW